MSVRCERCSARSGEFFSCDDTDDIVFTYAGSEVVPHVDRLPEGSYLMIWLPGNLDSDGYRDGEPRYLCPACVQGLRDWYTSGVKASGREVDL